MALPFDDVGSTQLVRGAFKFDIGALREARSVVVNESRVITNEFKKVGNAAQETATKTQKTAGIVTSALNKIANSFRNAKDEAERFAKTDLGVIRNGLRDISQQFAALSASAGLFAAGGLAASQNIKKTEVALRGLAGSAEEAAKITQITRDLSNEFGLPFVSLLEGAKELVPVSRRTNTEMDRLLRTMVKLQGAVPDKSFSELRFSFSELLSGDKTSAQDILSILGSRDDFSKVAGFAREGDINAALDALDQMIAKSGITDEYFQDLKASGVGAFDRVKSAAQEALDAGFRPILDDFVVPAAEGFADFLTQLRETNPELLQIAAAGSLIVAGIAPATFAVSKMIDAFKMLKDAGMTAFSIIRDNASAAINTLKDLPGIIKNNSSLLNANASSWKDAGLGTKLGVGAAAIGAGVVIGGQVTQGLANAGVQGGDFDRIRKGEDPLAIAGERFKQVIVILAAGLVEFARLIAKIAATIGNAIDQFINVFRVGGTLLSELFSQLQQTFGKFISGIADLLSGVMDTSGLKLAGANLQFQGGNSAYAAQKERERLLARLREGFALPQETSDSIDQTFNDLGASVVGGLNNFFFPPVQEAGEQIVEELTQVAEQFQSAAEDMFSDDMVDAWGDFQDELEKIAADAEKERIAENKKYEADKTKLEADQQAKREAALVEFNRKQAEREIKLGWDIIDINADFEEREKEEAKKFRRDERKARRDHYMTLLQAAAALDGRAIYLENLRYKNEQKEREADSRHDKNHREKERDKRIADLQLQFDRESQLQNNNFWKVEMPQLIAQQTAEYQQFEAAHQERLTQITTHATEESAAAEQAFIDTFNKLIEAEGTHQDMMLGEQRKGQAAMEAELKAWWGRQKALVAGTGSTTTTQPGYVNSDINDPAPNQSDGFPQLPPPPPGGVGGTGGQTPVGNLSLPNGREAARLASMAVRGGSTQAAALREGSSKNGTKGADGGLHIGTLAPTIVLGDIGKRSDKDVEALVERSLMKTLKKLSGDN